MQQSVPYTYIDFIYECPRGKDAVGLNDAVLYVRPGRNSYHGFHGVIRWFRWSHGYLKVCWDFTVLYFRPPHTHTNTNRLFVNTKSDQVSTLIIAEKKWGKQNSTKSDYLWQDYHLEAAARSLCRSFGSILDFWSRKITEFVKFPRFSRFLCSG